MRSASPKTWELFRDRQNREAARNTALIGVGGTVVAAGAGLIPGLISLQRAKAATAANNTAHTANDTANDALATAQSASNTSQTALNATMDNNGGRGG